MSSYNVKYQVSNDILDHSKYVYPHNLESKKYLDFVNDWTMNHKMKIIQMKMKSMIFNFTNNHHFTTRLEINGENVN